MNRFFGMMPANQTEVTKHYRDEYNNKIMIQAGNEGWTVIYADHSCDFDDVTAPVEDNFKTAYTTAVDTLGRLTEDDIC